MARLYLGRLSEKQERQLAKRYGNGREATKLLLSIYGLGWSGSVWLSVAIDWQCIDRSLAWISKKRCFVR